MAVWGPFFAEAGVPFEIQHFSSQFRFHFPAEIPQATLLVFRLLERGIYIRETHQNCFLSTVHTDADIAEFVSAVKECVTELQEAEFFPGTPLPSTAPAAPTPIAASPFPLTDAQREIWLACQSSSGASCAYNESFTLTLRGPLDVPALQASVQALVDRHEALRLTFAADGSSQQAAPMLSLDIGWDDWSGLVPAERASRVAGIPAHENATPFNLVQGPLVRVRLCRLAPTEHLLVFTAHHLVCDGWSSGVLLGDLAAGYTARIAGRTPYLPSAISFSHFAGEEENERRDAAAGATDRYWTERFRDAPPLLELPTDFVRSANASNRCGIERSLLDAALCTGLKRVAAAHGATLFSALLSAFNVLLLRHSDCGRQTRDSIHMDRGLFNRKGAIGVRPSLADAPQPRRKPERFLRLMTSRFDMLTAGSMFGSGLELVERRQPCTKWFSPVGS